MVSRRKLLRYLAPGTLAAGAAAFAARPVAADAGNAPTLQSITGWASVADFGGDRTGGGVRGQAVRCAAPATGVRDLAFSGAGGSTADAVVLSGQASAASGLWFERLGGWMVRVQ